MSETAVSAVDREAKTAGAPATAAPPAGGAASRPLAGPRGMAFFLVMALALAAIDLWTKDLVFSRIGEHEVIEVIPGFFNLIQAKNLGAAFSVGWGQRNLFVIVSGIAFAVLSWFSWSNRTGGKAFQVTLAMVASGVIGNVHDRVRFGYVRDFIDWYAGNGALAEWLVARFNTQHWPTFNVADSCICVGTALLLIKFWKDEKAAERAAKADAAGRSGGAGA